MKIKEKALICYICDKEGARIRKVSEAFGKGKDLLVIEEIPMVSCPNCGESYFTAEKLHEIERNKQHRASVAAQRQVEVAAFV